MKKYTYGGYLTIQGWGGEGVFLTAGIIKKHADRRDHRPLINISSVVVGTGEGWEPDIILDSKWIEKAVKLMNLAEKE